jgi:hypothetical protein
MSPFHCHSKIVKAYKPTNQILFMKSVSMEPEIAGEGQVEESKFTYVGQYPRTA